MDSLKKGTDVQPICVPYPNNTNGVVKPILLCTSRITEDRFWANGIVQNIMFLYKIFEIGGYYPYIFMSEKPQTQSDFLKQFRIIDRNDWNKNPFILHAYIEISLSFVAGSRKALKASGAHIYKLCLGNMVSMDIEHSIYYNDRDFPHHVIGGTDTVLFLPHHDFQQEYVSAINNIFPVAKITPYLWEPLLIHDLYDSFQWNTKGPYSFTIMEPNISFLKCSLVPLMLCDSYYRETPGLVDGVVVVNGEILNKSVYFKESILQNLDLHKSKKLHLLQRFEVRKIAQTFKHNIVVMHGVNNDYNNLFFEFLYLGFPVVHNYEKLRNFGYYYKDNDIKMGAKLIDTVIKTHGANLEAYKGKNREFFRNFSIYNPDNIKIWQSILG